VVAGDSRQSREKPARGSARVWERVGQLAATGFQERPNMKATPSVAKATVSKQIVRRTIDPAKAPPEPQVEALGLSPEGLNARAFTSTHVMTEILERDTRSHSFRHWGINE
jgi:hypothetical protein